MASQEAEQDIGARQLYEEQLHPKILAHLNSADGLSWLSFTLVEISKSQYIIKIGSEQPKDPKWDEVTNNLRNEFKNVLKDFPRVGIDVETTQASPATEAFRYIPPGEPQPYDRSSKNPFGVYSLGRSIGVEQYQGAGTLGGFITVIYNKQPRVYGLTNFHVVNKRGFGDAGKKSVTDGYRVVEINKDVDRETLPANKKKKILEAELKVENSKEKGRNTQITDELLEERASFSLPDIQNNTIYCPSYDDVEATKKHEEKLEQDSEERPLSTEFKAHKLGQARVSSGATVTRSRQNVNQYCMADWALIDLNGPAQKTMRDLNRKLTPNFQLANKPIRRAVQEYFPPTLTYDPTIRLHNGMTVYKWGRTTGVRRGDVNDIVLNLRGWEEAHGAAFMRPEGLMRAIKQNPANDVIREWMVIGKTRHENGRECLPFCGPGDSGSLVVDGQGHVVGLIWGLYSAGFSTDVTLVTDIQVIFDSIISKLGGPSKAGIGGTATNFA